MTAELLFLWKAAGAALALALAPGTIEILCLTVAGMFQVRTAARSALEKLYHLTIIIPAHDEELGIGRCITSIRRADSQGVHVRVVVVADNCSDQTATVARAAGAEVLIRCDRERRGKGYALDFAFKVLEGSGNDGFAVIDADTEIDRNFIIETAAALRAGADATQCRYLVRNSNATVRIRLMRIALAAYNVLRPRGRERLGFSAGLYGNGFGLAAETVRAVPYAARSVVEDVEYHLALLAAGRRVTFLDRTTVYADMPVAGPGIDNQRARWEGGRFRMIYSKLPGVLRRIARFEFGFAEACLDLLLLPLAFHVVLLLVVLLTPTAAVRYCGAAGLSIALLHLIVAAFVAGNGVRDLPALFSAPLYIVWKLLLIPKLHRSSKADAEWIRTERAGEAAKP